MRLERFQDSLNWNTNTSNYARSLPTIQKTTNDARGTSRLHNRIGNKSAKIATRKDVAQGCTGCAKFQIIVEVHAHENSIMLEETSAFKNLFKVQQGNWSPGFLSPTTSRVLSL